MTVIINICPIYHTAPHLDQTIFFFLQFTPNKDLFFLVKKIAELPPFAEKILNKVFEGPSIYELIEKLL